MENQKRKKLTNRLTYMSLGLGWTAVLLFYTDLIFYANAKDLFQSPFLSFVFSWVVVLFSLVAILLGLTVFFRLIKEGFLSRSSIIKIGSLVGSALLIVSSWTSFFQIVQEQRSRVMSGEYQLSKLAKAIQVYASNNQGRLPIAGSWCDLLIAADKRLSVKDFRLPRRYSDEFNFAFNENVSGMLLSEVNPQTILLIVVEGKWNQRVKKESLGPISYQQGVDFSPVLLQNSEIWVYFFRDDILKRNYSKEAALKQPRWRP
jgi:hypothetical protein